MTQHRLPGRARRVLDLLHIGYLLGGPYAIAYDTLANATEIDRRSVVGIIKQLESAGLITVDRQPTGTRGRPNIYRVNLYRVPGSTI